MKFVYRGGSRKLARAVAFANQLRSNEAFWLDIAARPGFDFCALTGAQLVRRLRQSTSAIAVHLWTPPAWNARTYRKTVAITDPRRPHQLFYHGARTGLPVSSMVKTLAHAFVRNVDLFEGGARFLAMEPDGQSPIGNEETAPYWIGELAQTYYWSAHSAEKSADEPLMLETEEYVEGAVADENIVDDTVDVD